MISLPPPISFSRSNLSCLPRSRRPLLPFVNSRFANLLKFPLIENVTIGFRGVGKVTKHKSQIKLIPRQPQPFHIFGFTDPTIPGATQSTSHRQLAGIGYTPYYMYVFTQISVISLVHFLRFTCHKFYEEIN